MAPILPDIPRDRNGLFYVDPKHVELISIPVSKEPGGEYRISSKDLSNKFGISDTQMNRLPKNLIVPRLRSDWYGGDEGWWSITGEVGVYEPLEWVPCADAVRTIPQSEITTTLTRTTSSTKSSSLYGAVTSEITASGSGGFGPMKFEAKVTVEAKVEAKMTTEATETWEQKGVFGQKAMKEVIIGMSLKVRQVHAHSVDLKLNAKSLWFADFYSWNQLMVTSRDLEHLTGLQFHPPSMEGSGHRDTLWLQVVPEFDSNNKVIHTHLAFGHDKWENWYWCTNGKEETRDEEETIRWGGFEPLCSFIAVGEEETQ